LSIFEPQAEHGVLVSEPSVQAALTELSLEGLARLFDGGRVFAENPAEFRVSRPYGDDSHVGSLKNGLTRRPVGESYRAGISLGRDLKRVPSMTLSATAKLNNPPGRRTLAQIMEAG
jgi:hypothetical protein